MISVEEARGLVMANLPPRRVVDCDFQDTLDRVLAEDIVAGTDIPPFCRSMMDGYAIRSADASVVPVQLVLIGESRAGKGFDAPLGMGQAVAIMTGAPVPRGADAVQAIEHSGISEDHRSVIILKAVKPGENITQVGAEVSRGDVVLEAGRFIGPPEVAILASLGVCRTRVFRPPRVATIATGDELVEPEHVPLPDQIRNSNAYSLRAQLRQIGIAAEYLGIASDNEDSLKAMMQEGLKRDVLIMTGGVSVGAYDRVKSTFREMGLTIIFEKVAMRPGKPTVFARTEDHILFGLPGNPLSTFVAFENFVRPALGYLCGFNTPGLPRIRGILGHDMKQHPGRTSFLPARAAWDPGGWKIDPIQWKGSADVFGFARGNALVIFPAGSSWMRSGESVEALLLPDYSARIAAS